MIALAEGVLERTFEHLRECGAGERECVVYLTGPALDASIVDGVVHPRHTAGPGGYDVAPETLAELWRELVETSRSVRIQVHTHPGAAYHSSRDDALAVVHSSGFLSLVIPDFAMGEMPLARAFLAKRTEPGTWAPARISEELNISR